jgi:BTB And C-terminal Kelch
LLILTISFNILQVIQKSTEQVLSDKSWLEAPEEVVLKVLQTEALHITESVLFSYLVKWGRAQVEDEEIGVRAKIDDFLKNIKFCTMECTEFSNLCCQPIPLTLEEKYKIFLGITQRNPEFLPEGFSKTTKPRCIEGKGTYWWNVFESGKVSVNSRTEPVVLTFSINSTCYFNGLCLRSLSDINAGKQVELTCDVYSSENPSLCLTSATFCGIVQADGIGDEDLDFPWPVLMRPGIFFTVKVTYKHTKKRRTFVFENSADYTWEDSDPIEELTVRFANNIESITDISGLCMSRRLV